MDLKQIPSSTYELLSVINYPYLIYESNPNVSPGNLNWHLQDMDDNWFPISKQKLDHLLCIPHQTSIVRPP